VRRVPQDGPDIAAAADLVSSVVGQGAAMPFPAFHPLVELCRNQAGGDPQRAQQCRTISDVMYAHSDSMLVAGISGALLFQTTGDASRRDQIRAERIVAAAHWAPATGLSSCRELRDEMRKLQRRAEAGEVEAMREESRKFVAP
jgi:hypothetical protein